MDPKWRSKWYSDIQNATAARPRRQIVSLLPQLATSRISLCALVFCAFSLSAAGAEESAAESVHALLINGGHRPASNYLSHLHHIEEMLDLLDHRGLRREHIHIFSADGREDAADLAARDTLPSDFWLIEDTRIGNQLRPRTELSNTEWSELTVHPARRDS